jgi:beta-mannanase
MAAVALTFVTLAYQAATSLPATAVSGKVPLPPTGKAYFGTYSPPSPGKAWTTENQQNEYLNLERSLGRTLDVAQYYYDWSASFPTWRETWHVQSGRIPMISWDGINTDTVGSGSQDTLIRARADSVKAFAQPVFVRWMWEMDASWRGTTVRSPSSFIAAWRHIVTIFRTRGATNATFVWCPTAWGFESGVAQTYYPGDSYVDWICADAYNWAPGRRGAKWRQLSEAIPTFYAWSMPHGKPLMLGEYGCQERSANEKATWFSTVRTDLKSKFPGIRAVVYFDSYTLYDWRLDTSTSALNAFKSMARDSYFNP